MNKKIKFSLISIFLIGAIILIAFFLSNSKTTISATKGGIVYKISEIGRLVSSQEYNLSYDVGGDVKNVLVTVGQKIKTGDVLMELDKKELEIKLVKAQAGKSVAQARLNQLLAGAKNEDIEVYEKAIYNADVKVSSAEVALSDAEKNMSNTQSQATRNLEEKYSSALNILNEAYIGADDAVLRRTEEMFLNDSTDNPGLSFTSSNLQAEGDSKNLRVKAGKELKTFKLEVDNLSNDYINIDQALINAKNYLLIIDDFLSQLIIVTDSAIDLSDATVNLYKGYINTGRTNVNNALTNIDNLQQSILTQRIKNETSIDQSWEAKNNAEATLNSALANLTVAKSELAAIKAGPRLVDQNVYGSQIDVAEGEVRLLQEELADMVLLAPNDGIITKIDIEAGEKVFAQQNVISLMSDSFLEIEVYIAEENILQIKKGQVMEFTMDAFGKDKKFIGEVVSVDPAATIIEDEIYYKVTGKVISDLVGALEGMTSDVDIVIDQKKDIIKIPSQAIRSEADLDFVIIKTTPWQTKKRQVSLGLSGGGWVEIVSGLVGNEEILIK